MQTDNYTSAQLSEPNTKHETRLQKKCKKSCKHHDEPGTRLKNQTHFFYLNSKWTNPQHG